MVQFRLPKNSQITNGHIWKAVSISENSTYEKPNLLTVKIYRYNYELEKNPSIDTYLLKKSDVGNMVLDALIYIKNNIDPTLSFRRSCREGICGSCAMNINGKNSLACITTLDNISQLTIYPLPHMFVLRDLVVDLKQFYDNYHSVKPWLQNTTDTKDKKERLQSIEDRNKLDGLYDCILCACCSTACPSFWWNSEKFLGPSALLYAYRWITDSRDENKQERLKYLDDIFRLYRCHTITNCSHVCPKGLSPASAISKIKMEIASHDL